MIDPGGIPSILTDVDAVAGHATELQVAGVRWEETGAEVDTTWKALPAFYSAPEGPTLFGLTEAVLTRTADVGAQLISAGQALSVFALEVREIKQRLEALRAEAAAFVASVGGQEYWQDDTAKADEHNLLLTQVSTQVAAWETAQRNCANAITHLYNTCITYVADNGDGNPLPGEFGLTPAARAELAHSAQGLDWGTAEEGELDQPWYLDVLTGTFADGLWGDIKGMGAMVGIGGSAKDTWIGLGTLALSLNVPAHVLNSRYDLPGLKKGTLTRTLKETGKGLVAWDEWGRNPSRAAGTVGYTVASALIPTKLGALAKGAAVAEDVACAAGDAGKVSHLAGAAAATAGRDVAREVTELSTIEARTTNARRPDPGLSELKEPVRAADLGAVPRIPPWPNAPRERLDVPAEVPDITPGAPQNHRIGSGHIGSTDSAKGGNGAAPLPDNPAHDAPDAAAPRHEPTPPSRDVWAKHRGDYVPPENYRVPSQGHRFVKPEMWVDAINPGGEKAPGRNTNCGECTRAVESSWRGRPETAAALARPQKMEQREVMEAWLGVDARPTSYAGIHERLLDAGPGSSAVIGDTWFGGNRHWFNAVNDNGVIKAVDGRSGRVETWPPSEQVLGWDWKIVKETVAILRDPRGRALDPSGDLNGTRGPLSEDDTSAADLTQTVDRTPDEVLVAPDGLRSGGNPAERSVPQTVDGRTDAPGLPSASREVPGGDRPRQRPLDPVPDRPRPPQPADTPDYRGPGSGSSVVPSHGSGDRGSGAPYDNSTGGDRPPRNPRESGPPDAPLHRDQSTAPDPDPASTSNLPTTHDDAPGGTAPEPHSTKEPGLFPTRPDSWRWDPRHLYTLREVHAYVTDHPGSRARVWVSVDGRKQTFELMPGRYGVIAFDEHGAPVPWPLPHVRTSAKFESALRDADGNFCRLDPPPSETATTSKPRGRDPEQWVGQARLDSVPYQPPPDPWVSAGRGLREHFGLGRVPAFEPGRGQSIMREWMDRPFDATDYDRLEAELRQMDPGSAAVVVSKWNRSAAGHHGEGERVFLAVEHRGDIVAVDVANGKVGPWPPHAEGVGWDEYMVESSSAILLGPRDVAHLRHRPFDLPAAVVDSSLYREVDHPGDTAAREPGSTPEVHERPQPPHTDAGHEDAADAADGRMQHGPGGSPPSPDDARDRRIDGPDSQGSEGASPDELRPYDTPMPPNHEVWARLSPSYTPPSHPIDPVPPGALFRSPEEWAPSVNPGVFTEIGADTNCGDCVRAVEHNWRGRPQQAAMCWDTGEYESVMADWLGKPLESSTYNDIETILTREGPGSSAIVISYWTPNSSHLFNVVNDNGVLKAVDGQSGLVETWPPTVSGIGWDESMAERSVAAFIDRIGRVI